MPQEDHDNLVLHEELSADHPDSLIRNLHLIIRGAVRLLAVLMVIVILLSIADVVYVLYDLLINQPPRYFLRVTDIFKVFGAIMVVLIAVEIFVNIRLYLGSNVVPVQLVIATALMAIARKVIVLDLTVTSPMYVLGIAAVLLALGITYWLMTRKHR